MIRLLVLDESLPTRLATELCRRGRPATTNAALGLRGAGDTALLAALGEHLPDCILVTPDDHLPADHAAAVRSVGVGIATIDPGGRPEHWTQDQWNRDVVHRWAHRMQAQEGGSVRRYGVSPREWVVPTRVRSRRR